MKDNSDIPLPVDEIRSKVLVFAIIDQVAHEYEQITKGYVEISTDQDDNNRTIHVLQVKDETSNEVLMRSNLKLQSNFGKQKGSIISWTDQQQPQYQEIALSFEKDRQCDMFWRTICQKIGKNYLEISGTQKLQTPNFENLNYILQKAKNNIDLMDYNIVHSKAIMKGLRQVFIEMKNDNDEMGMGVISRIINTIMVPSYSSTAIQTLLTSQNFDLILEVQSFKKGISFRQVYESKVGSRLKNKFDLPNQIFQKVELNYRATFYRENVLELGEEAQLQSMMLMVSKEALVQIISFLNRSKFLQKVISFTEYPETFLNSQKEKDQFISAENYNLNEDKINFVREALLVCQQMASQQIKTIFKQNLYNSDIFEWIKGLIQSNNTNVMQILQCITEIDKIKFFQFLIQDFRNNPTQNLLKVIMKKFIHQPSFLSSIIYFIQSLALIFNQKKQFFDFFNGTFLCSVFPLAKSPISLLLLSNTLLCQLENSTLLFNQFIKFKLFEKFSSQYRSGSSFKTKKQQLELVKLLKHIIIEQSLKNQEKNKYIQANIIQSGFLDCCLMIFLKHKHRNNIISSSMLQNFKIIQKMEKSQFDEYLVKQSSSNQDLQRILEPIRKKYIENMNKQVNKSKQNEYIEVEQMAHQDILDNQQQDEYLMNEGIEGGCLNGNEKTEEGKEQKNLSNSTNQDLKKQNYLQYLKRMMDDLNDNRQEDEEQIEREPRKKVKRSEETPPISIEFNFDLPEIEDVGGQELGDT